jgi:hypothetical protein
MVVVPCSIQDAREYVRRLIGTTLLRSVYSPSRVRTASESAVPQNVPFGPIVRIARF